MEIYCNIVFLRVFDSFSLLVFGSKRERSFVMIVKILKIDIGRIFFILLLIILFCKIIKRKCIEK